jgi:pilus assembly protein CpaB
MRRPLGFFLLSGIAAMLAALVVYSALKQREIAIQRATAQSLDIVVAAHALPLGTKIDASAVKVVRWSRDAVPPGSYTDPAAITGAYVKDSFVENEPLVASKLFMGQKSAGVMPLLIPPGMRAMSVPVDKVSDVAGFVQPRTRVDVLVAMANSGATGDKPFSKTVLENVEVLAVNQEIQGDPAKAQVVEVVTLLVTPQEAERLALASRQGGNLRLAIRSYDDSKVVLTEGADLEDLRRVYSPAAPPVLESQNVAHHPVAAPRRPTVGVEIYRDGKTSESVSFIEASGEPVPTRARGARRAPATVSSESRETGRPDRAAATHAIATRAPSESSSLVGGAPMLDAVAGRAASAADSSDASSPTAGFVATPKTIDIP